MMGCGWSKFKCPICKKTVEARTGEWLEEYNVKVLQHLAEHMVELYKEKEVGK